jgi:hypothetical protein
MTSRPAKANHRVTEDTEKGGSIRMDEQDPLTQAIIGAAIEVHREMGPGLFERSSALCPR